MKKIGNLIKRHKILFSFCLVVLVATIVMLIFLLKIVINTSSNYGNRLEGIEKVKISTETCSDISNKIEEFEEVSKAKVRVQGKIIYIDINFNEKATQDKAKEIATKVLDEFEKDELEFYDFSFILNQTKENDEDDSFALAGAKNSIDSEISWVRS